MPESATTAGKALAAVMEEEGWNKREISLATGLDYKTVLRWIDGSSTPPAARVAEVLERLGRDPRAYGVNTPRPTAMTQSAPPWFTSEIAQLRAQLDEMHKLLKLINATKTGNK